VPAVTQLWAGGLRLRSCRGAHRCPKGGPRPGDRLETCERVRAWVGVLIIFLVER